MIYFTNRHYVDSLYKSIILTKRSAMAKCIRAVLILEGVFLLLLRIRNKTVKLPIEEITIMILYAIMDILWPSLNRISIGNSVLLQAVILLHIKHSSFKLLHYIHLRSTCKQRIYKIHM